MRTPNRRPASRDRDDDWALPASRAAIEPYVRLAAAIIANAMKDLRERDTIRALDALLWLMGDGLLFLRCLDGFEGIDPVGLLEVISKGERMERQNKGLVAEVFSGELAAMTPRELAIFRKLLEARLPEFVQELAAEVRESQPAERDPLPESTFA